MKREAVLVVDFGTSNVHVNAVDVSDGNIPYSASRKYEMLSPKDGYTEIDPERLWKASEEGVAQVLAELPADVTLRALTFSYFGDNLLPVDQDGNPLSNLILAFDVRGQREAEQEFAHRFTDARFTEITGGRCQSFLTPPKLLWMKKEAPELFRKAAGFYTNQQFVNRRLGLEPLNDRTMACRKSLYDIGGRRWSSELMDFLGIREDLLGAVVESTEVIGEISHYGDVALPSRLPVVIGSHDCDCGMLGVGAGSEESGVIGDITGTFDHLGYIAGRPLNVGLDQPGLLVNSYCGPLENSSVCLGAFPTSGATLDWFMREIIGNNSGESYDRMWEGACFDGFSDLLMSPHFTGGKGGFFRLGLTKTRMNLFESVIEALTCESRRILEDCKKVRKDSIHTIHIGGGSARSEKWLQLRADLWGCTVKRTQNIEVSSLGAAILAAVRTGIYPDVSSATEQMVRIRDVFYPNESCNERYEEKYELYRSTMKMQNIIIS